jgi:uncharacterized protein (TIGR04222 family)
MNEPWGISGPQFVALYVVALIVATIVTFVWRSRSRNAVVPPGQPPLTPEQIAFLAGGPNRMVDAALAALIEREAIRTVRGGRLHATKGVDPVTPAARWSSCAARWPPRRPSPGPGPTSPTGD